MHTHYMHIVCQSTRSAGIKARFVRFSNLVSSPYANKDNNSLHLLALFFLLSQSFHGSFPIICTYFLDKLLKGFVQII